MRCPADGKTCNLTEAACIKDGCQDIEPATPEYPPEWDEMSVADLPPEPIPFSATFPNQWGYPCKCRFLYDEARQDVWVDAAVMQIRSGEFFLHQWAGTAREHDGSWYVSLIAMEATNPVAKGARLKLIEDHRANVMSDEIAKAIGHFDEKCGAPR